MSNIFTRAQLQLFGLKMLSYFVADPDLGSSAFWTLYPGSVMEKH
jgi:hypothetical protein